jgi:signal transduction histidine kinase/AmiR/NasT family two-component response regulator
VERRGEGPDRRGRAAAVDAAFNFPPSTESLFLCNGRGRLLQTNGAGRGAEPACAWAKPPESSAADSPLDLTAADEARAEANRLVAMVSHEIRSPLSGVTGMLDLLQHTTLNEDQKELLANAKSSARLLQVLLDDLLDISKATAGKIAFEEIPFAVKSSVGGPLRLFAARAQAKGLAFAARWDLPPGCEMVGDPYRINQVVNNLLENALKFTATGRIDVETKCVAVSVPGQDWGRPDEWDLHVEVKDTGIGLREDQLPRLFQRFEQGDASTTRKFGGSGLGLSLCKRLCEGMGGEISARRRAGGGSAFSFVVRCKDANVLDIHPFADTEPAESAGQTPFAGRRVLVVDDNRINRTLLTRWLQEEGIDCACAEDGADAVKQATACAFDLILMDVSMPVMDGIDATKAIRKMATNGRAGGARYATVPIVGVSARAMDGDREICVAAGMNDYMTKPLERKRLRDCLRNAMNVRKQPPEPLNSLHIDLEL